MTRRSVEGPRIPRAHQLLTRDGVTEVRCLATGRVLYRYGARSRVACGLRHLLNSSNRPPLRGDVSKGSSGREASSPACGSLKESLLEELPVHEALARLAHSLQAS